MENKKVELLAPCGDFNKLKTALHFGADAVYIGGNAFSLRANAKNFGEEDLKEAVEFTHRLNKRIYVTVNIFAKNSDFPRLETYLQQLYEVGVDAVIISDPGVVDLCRKVAPNLDIHLSTQANTTNKYSAKFWADNGVKRVVLARETSLDDIKEISEFLPKNVELEAFIHGAMCISYSGRCLLSKALTGRDGNRGDCVQACRWEYEIREVNRGGLPLTIGQEARGTYILNSKDLNMLEHIKEVIEAGVFSLKVEGRMKTSYYVASVINAYRKAIDGYLANPENYIVPKELLIELEKTSHRKYTTGFYYGDGDNVCLDTSQPECNYEFIAEVLEYDKNIGIKVEMRNRFKKGDVLEVLSTKDEYFNKEIIIDKIITEKGEIIEDAKLVQQVLYLPFEMELSKGDILRKKV